jgi:hypothetical protein
VVNGQLSTCFLKTGHGLSFVSENNPIALERRAKLSPIGEIFPGEWCNGSVEAADLNEASTNRQLLV